MSSLRTTSHGRLAVQVWLLVYRSWDLACAPSAWRPLPLTSSLFVFASFASGRPLLYLVVGRKRTQRCIAKAMRGMRLEGSRPRRTRGGCSPLYTAATLVLRGDLKQGVLHSVSVDNLGGSGFPDICFHLVRLPPKNVQFTMILALKGGKMRTSNAVGCKVLGYVGLGERSAIMLLLSVEGACLVEGCSGYQQEVPPQCCCCSGPSKCSQLLWRKGDWLSILVPSLKFECSSDSAARRSTSFPSLEWFLV